MPSLKRLSVRTLILGSFAAVIAIVGAGFAGLWVEMGKIERNYQDVREQTLQTTAALRELEAAMSIEVEMNWSHSLAVHGKRVNQAVASAGASDEFFDGAIANEVNELTEVRERIERAWQAFASIRDPDHRASEANFRTKIGELMEHMQQDSRLLEQSAATSPIEEMIALLEDFAQEGEAFRDLTAEALAEEDAELAEKDTQVREAFRHGLFTIAAAAILVLVVGLLAVAFLTRRVAAPLRQLRDAAQAVGQGQFAVALPGSAGGEVGELARSFGDMAERLQETVEKMSRQEKLSVIGQLAGTVSHDLRNPLAAIGTSLETLRHANASKGFGIERTLDRMQRSVGRCNAIVSELLDFTRTRDLNREPTAIDQWLAEVLDEHMLTDSVSVVREFGAGVEAMIDRESCRRVVINLLDNAAQAMTTQGWTAPDGRAPSITVRAESAGPHVRLSVADNGPGIKPDSLAKIFEPLFTTKSFGVGLGLPLVRQVIEQHGGTIDVESVIDVGTTFTVFLPRQPQHGQKPAAIQTAAA